MDGEPRLFYATLIIVIAVLGGLAAVKYFPPRLSGLVPPPLYVNLTNVSAQGDRLTISLNVSRCLIKPDAITVLLLLNDKVVEEASLSSPSCGANNLTVYLSPYLVGRYAAIEVNATLGGRGYVLAYFVRLIEAPEVFRFVNVSFVNGTPLVAVYYDFPYTFNLSVLELQDINSNNSALILYNCNSTRPIHAEAGEGYLLVPLRCSYVNIRGMTPGAVYSLRGAVYVTYYTPYGNFSYEVGLIDSSSG
jgi:hypothetical protein